MMIRQPRPTAWMFVPLIGALALLMSLRPTQHGPTPRAIAEEDVWESYRWRVFDQNWRREHPGAARMLDQFEREVNEKRQRRLPDDDCSVDCQ